MKSALLIAAALLTLAQATFAWEIADCDYPENQEDEIAADFSSMEASTSVIHPMNFNHTWLQLAVEISSSSIIVLYQTSIQSAWVRWAIYPEDGLTYQNFQTLLASSTQDNVGLEFLEDNEWRDSFGFPPQASPWLQWKEGFGAGHLLAASIFAACLVFATVIRAYKAGGSNESD